MTVCSEDGGSWVEEQKLDAHHDWVRDVAWAPSVGLQRSIIASCSQVSLSSSSISVTLSDDNKAESCRFTVINA